MMLRIALASLLALFTGPALAVDFQAGYGLENNEAVGKSLTQCFSWNKDLTKAQQEREQLVCNMQVKEVTLLEYFSMQDGCSTFDSASPARSECDRTVTKLHRHFASDMPPVVLPPFTVYEQALLIEGCSRLSGDKRELCQSGANKLNIK